MEGYFVWRIISQVDRWGWMGWGHLWINGEMGDLKALSIKLWNQDYSRVVKSRHRSLRESDALRS